MWYCRYGCGTKDCTRSKIYTHERSCTRAKGDAVVLDDTVALEDDDDEKKKQPDIGDGFDEQQVRLPTAFDFCAATEAGASHANPRPEHEEHATRCSVAVCVVLCYACVCCVPLDIQDT